MSFLTAYFHFTIAQIVITCTPKYALTRCRYFGNFSEGHTAFLTGGVSY